MGWNHQKCVRDIILDEGGALEPYNKLKRRDEDFWKTNWLKMGDLSETCFKIEEMSVK